MKSKDLSASMARVVATLLVVLGHCFKRYSGWSIVTADYIYSFHMAFFFFLSGYVFALAYLPRLDDLSVKNFTLNRFKRLIIPLLFVKFFVINPINVWTGDYGWNSKDVYTKVDHLWYLMDLFVITILVMLIMKTGNFLLDNLDKMVIGITVASVIVSLSSYYLPSGGKSSIEGIYYYSAFFCIGMIIKRYNLLQYLGKKKVIFVNLLGGLCVWGAIEAGYLVQNDITRFLAALLSASGYLGICKIFDRKVVNNRFFALTESYSMPIYLFHIPILYCFDRKFILPIPPLLAIVVLFLVSYFLSVALGMFFRKLKLQILIGE